MFDSRNQSSWRVTAAKVLVALIGVTGCLAAVAYAASSPPAPGGDRVPARALGSVRSGAALTPSSRPGRPRLARPRITAHPASTTVSTTATFRFTHRLPEARFQCKLDDASWKQCAARAAYRGLTAGPHRFLVRAEARAGSRSLPARFAWTQLQAKAFSIEAELSGLGRLYPGAPPVTVPLVVRNPNPAPIFVIGLRVSVTGDPPGCGATENLRLIQASPSSATPLTVPAGGAVSLPAAGVTAPAIALRDLPVNQDACQGAQFPLAFSGEAHG